MLQLKKNSQMHSLKNPQQKCDSASGRVRVATYNVENFWDDIPNNTRNPYDDFKPEISNWYKEKIADKKAQRIAEAVELAGQPEIVAFQEFESAENQSRSMEILKPYLQALGYQFFAVGEQDPSQDVAVTTAIASKYPIVKNESLKFSSSNFQQNSSHQLASDRDPQVVTLDVNGVEFRVYVSHWKSKRGEEKTQKDGKRTQIATLIKQDIDAFRKKNKTAEVIALGDFNSTHNEEALLIGMNSGNYKEQLIKAPQDPKMHNLWYELPEEERCSYNFRGSLECIDHIVVSGSAFDGHGYDLVPGGLHVIGHQGGIAAEKMMVRGKASLPFRWQIKKTYSQPYQKGVFHAPATVVHSGEGFSDHLPLVAEFAMTPSNCQPSR
jgi:predicted extracellular nuclease